jgi:hypothetical protein
MIVMQTEYAIEGATGGATDTVDAAHPSGSNFAQNSFAYAGFGNTQNNNWRGRFPHSNLDFHNW